MREFLAVDAGGTSTRAVVVDPDGRCHGYGRAAGGNPTSRGLDAATTAVLAATGQALGAAGPDIAVERVLLAHAGGAGAASFPEAILRVLQARGLHAPLTPAGDLLALYASGTAELDGAALLSGTGATGGAIRHGALARVIDGTGWLLGDSGSGFWIGHRVARAVVDDLDGGPATALTPAVLGRLGLDDDRVLVGGRPRVVGRIVNVLYDLRPVELAGFAPLAFELGTTDEVARRILRGAVAALAGLLDRVRSFQAGGPLVFGGSVLVEGVLRLDPDLLAPLLDAADGSTPIPVPDGLVGAAVLALREGGVDVDAELFLTLQSGIRAAAAAWLP